MCGYVYVCIYLYLDMYLYVCVCIYKFTQNDGDFFGNETLMWKNVLVKSSIKL